MKKLLTLCLALAMTASVGAYALTTLSGNAVTANAADEATTEAKTELTVKASEAYVYKTDTPDERTNLTASIGSGTITGVQKNIGATLVTDQVTSADSNIYLKFATAVDASEYTCLTFKALYWANGSNYLDTKVSNLAGNSSTVAGIYGIQSKSVSGDILWVKVPTAAIKNAEGKVDGILLTPTAITASMSAGYFLISDFTFTHDVILDYTDSGIVQDWFAIDLWKTENMRNAYQNISGTIRKTIKFKYPISVNSVDYFDFKVLIWGTKGWLPFNVYKTGAETANQNSLVFNNSSTSDLSVYEGNLDMRVAAKGLEDENGLINGFDIEVTGMSTGWHLVFSDITAVTEDLPLAILDERRTTAENNKWGFQTTNWANVPEWASNEVLYGGRDFATSTYNIVLKYPVDSKKVKTIDFKALLWNDAAVKQVQIAKPDGTATEVINVQAGWTEVFQKDINVKVNAELLAEENGLVYGFKMNAINDNSAAFQFSKFTSGAEEKTYTVTYKADGHEDITKTFTAANKAAYTAPEVPNKEHYTGVWDKEIAFTEGQVINAVYTAIEYTATFKNGNETVGTVKYTAENKDTVTIPTVPAKDHYTGAWSAALDLTDNQVINAVYTAIQYSVIFKADGEIVDTKTYTIETESELTAPQVPAKAHYTGAWETYTLNHTATQEVNAVYTAIEYTATFKNGNDTVGTVKYTAENKDAVTIPTVPNKEHYTSAWGGELNLTDNQVINAVHTAIEYTITFKADGETVGTVTYTVENKDNITAPEVPEKSGYTGKWADFEVAYDNTQVVEAEYTKKPEAKKGCKGSASGLGITLAAIGMAAVALKKKRG